MKLSISNISWGCEQDNKIYQMMKNKGYTGLEIAPTRIFVDKPYEKTRRAKLWAIELKKQYGLVISSMQSIWYGRTEKLFGSREERQALLNYTPKAINFAEAIGCRNLVFGCPVNRNLPQGVEDGIAVDFFRELGEYAAAHGTVIGMEANPPIYHTNYVNNTSAALELIRQVDSRGFMLNLDVGTMIYNGEDVSKIAGNVQLINHVHISEPWLNPIEERKLHLELKKVLTEEGYEGFVSIEMGRAQELTVIEKSLDYIGRVFQ